MEPGVFTFLRAGSTERLPGGGLDAGMMLAQHQQEYRTAVVLQAVGSNYHVYIVYTEILVGSGCRGGYAHSSQQLHLSQTESVPLYYPFKSKLLLPLWRHSMNNSISVYSSGFYLSETHESPWARVPERVCLYQPVVLTFPPNFFLSPVVSNRSHQCSRSVSSSQS